MKKEKFISSDEEESVTSANEEESSMAQDKVDSRAHSRSRIEGEQNKTSEHHGSQEISSVDQRHENKQPAHVAPIIKKVRLISSWKKDQNQLAKIPETNRTIGHEIDSDYANFEPVSSIDENQKTLQLVSCPSNEDPESMEESKDQYEANDSFYVSDDELANPGPSYFTCDICNQKFETKCLLKEHKETHNVDKSSSNRILDKVCSKRKTLNYSKLKLTNETTQQCNQSLKKFFQKQNLVAHKRIDNENNPYKCDKCEKSMSERYNFKKHQKYCGSLSEDKKFTCDKCCKKFTRQNHLNSHYRIHTGDKPYQCDICHKKFNLQCNLNRHYRIHTGEKPYQCDKCQKKFTKKSNLKSHYRIHTGLKPFKCRRCGKNFSDASNFCKHQKKCESLNEKEPKE